MQPINVLDILQHVRRSAVRLLLWSAGLAVLAYAGSYAIPPMYQASAVILPPDDDDLTSALSSARRGALGIPGLGKIGGSYFTQADVALATLRSRSVAERIARRFDLIRVYKAKNLEDAVLELKSRSTIRIGSDGTISVSVRDRSKERVADLANAYFESLDEFNRVFRTSRARTTREFLERRVARTDSLLGVSERALATYQSRKGSILLGLDAREGLSAGAGLMAQKTLAETELDIVRGYTTPGSEELQRLETRVRELGRQIGKLPTTQTGGADLLRTVVVQQQVLGLLTTQLEEARLREVMDTPTIQILDRASPPERRVWPRRALIAGFGGALGLALGVYYSRGLMGSRAH